MVQVRVSEGVLEGEVVQNEFGGSFYSFKGIPYAEPPLGDLRFKAPQPPKPWDGVRSAKEFGSTCFQSDTFMNTGITGTEDCLYLNVYTPNIAPKDLLPVMVWVHGGGFFSGSGNDEVYGPEFLVRQDVILVTLNYRLEVLGFLCLDTKDVPGNAGMKDQAQALRWVQKNIKNFGGNPKNVTIFGESAGGVSVSFLLLSPMCKGLFMRAIMQSGVATCDWAQVYSPQERAFALGRKLGLYTDDVQELYEFLKKQPVESLVEVRVPILFSEKVTDDIMGIFFNIVDEKPFGDQERFFYGNVYENLKHGIADGIDVITGCTLDEGIMCILGLEEKIYLSNNYFQFFVPKPLARILPIDQQPAAGKSIKRYYFKDKLITTDDWEQLVKYYSMSMFIFGTMQWAKLCARRQKSNVYLYKFSCKSERNMTSYLIGADSVVGNNQVTGHADDLAYLFNSKLIPTKLDPKSDAFQIIERVTKLWTNFAKYGNPTPDNSLGVRWNPFSLDKEEYLDIGNTLEARARPDHEEIKFWEDVYRKHAPQTLAESMAKILTQRKSENPYNRWVSGSFNAQSASLYRK